MSLTSVSEPGLWDALRGAGARRELEELLDRPDVDPSALAGNLRDLRRLNRVLGWSAAMWDETAAVLDRHGPREATLLDVATGSADIPRDIGRRAHDRGTALRVLASDISAAVLAQARVTGAPGQGVALIQHDGAALPFRDGAIDIVTCCLAAHHFAPDALTRLLREMWRVARRAVIVSDLERGRAGYLAARAMALVLRNRLTAHDGPVSVLRAYTPAELRAIARTAGIERVRLRRVFPARMMLVAERGGGS